MKKIVWEPIPDYGLVMTMREYYSSVENGFIIDYDGYGHYATAEQMSTIIAAPSRFKNDKGLFDRFTHVVWFNR